MVRKLLQEGHEVVVWNRSSKQSEKLKLEATLRQSSGQGSKKLEVPAEVMELVKEREELRKKKRFHLADDIRAKISKLGYELLDSGKETIIKKA